MRCISCMTDCLTFYITYLADSLIKRQKLLKVQQYRAPSKSAKIHNMKDKILARLKWSRC